MPLSMHMRVASCSMSAGGVAELMQKVSRTCAVPSSVISRRMGTRCGAALRSCCTVMSVRHIFQQHI